MPFGPMEMLVVAVVALLLFGKDLPNVAREWGKAFTEFRRHLHSVKSELNDAIYSEPDRPRLEYHPEFHQRGEASVIDAPAASDAPTADASSGDASGDSASSEAASPELASAGNATPSD